jgi:hypothetical protein
MNGIFPAEMKKIVWNLPYSLRSAWRKFAYRSMEQKQPIGNIELSDVWLSE